MITALKRQMKAAEYRRLALEAATLAAASTLDHVREKHQLAAARWTALAALDEAPRDGQTGLVANLVRTRA